MLRSLIVMAAATSRRKDLSSPIEISSDEETCTDSNQQVRSNIISRPTALFEKFLRKSLGFGVNDETISYARKLFRQAKTEFVTQAGFVSLLHQCLDDVENWNVKDFITSLSQCLCVESLVRPQLVDLVHVTARHSGTQHATHVSNDVTNSCDKLEGHGKLPDKISVVRDHSMETVKHSKTQLINEKDGKSIFPDPESLVSMPGESKIGDSDDANINSMHCSQHHRNSFPSRMLSTGASTMVTVQNQVQSDYCNDDVMITAVTHHAPTCPPIVNNASTSNLEYSMNKQKIDNRSAPNNSEKVSKNVKSRVEHSSDAAERREMNIKALKQRLHFYAKELERLAKTELSLDEMDQADSSYLEECKLKNKYLQVHRKLCRYDRAMDPLDKHPFQSIKIVGSPYPEINREAEVFISTKHDRWFPDIFDIKTIVSKANSLYNIGLRPKEVMDCAREVFCEIGDKLQRQRKRDFSKYSGCFLTDQVPFDDDPAFKDSELKRKLKNNRKISKDNMEHIFRHFSGKQNGHNDRARSDYDDSNDDDNDDKPSVNNIQNKIRPTLTASANGCVKENRIVILTKATNNVCMQTPSNIKTLEDGDEPDRVCQPKKRSAVDDVRLLRHDKRSKSIQGNSLSAPTPLLTAEIASNLADNENKHSMNCSNLIKEIVKKDPSNVLLEKRPDQVSISTDFSKQNLQCFRKPDNRIKLMTIADPSENQKLFSSPARDDKSGVKIVTSSHCSTGKSVNDSVCTETSTSSSECKTKYSLTVPGFLEKALHKVKPDLERYFVDYSQATNSVRLDRNKEQGTEHSCSRKDSLNDLYSGIAKQDCAEPVIVIDSDDE